MKIRWTVILAAIILVPFATYMFRQGYVFVFYRTVIIADGKRHVVHPKPMTVGALLNKRHIAVDENDIVTPPLTAPIPRRGTIRVIRVTEKIEKQTEIPPFEIIWKKRKTDNLRPTELQKGIQKSITRTIKTVSHDGKPVDRQIVGETETKKTVYRLVLLNKDDVIVRIYDLSNCKKMKMVATAYYPGDPLAWKDGTKTFLGMKMQRGIVAVDPKVIPLRTRVYIPGFGYGYAGDTGSAIKKQRIDLGVNNAREEKKWMHKKVTVYVLDQCKEY